MPATRRTRSRTSTRSRARTGTRKGTRRKTTRKYGKAATKNVERTMRRRKRGTLRSGSGRKVRSRKQAVAIGLAEAREKGAKVPRPRRKK